MNHQTMIDWAFQQPIRPRHKLVLIGLCLHCGADGGGSIKLGILAKGVGDSFGVTLDILATLQQCNLIILDSMPRSLDPALSADSEIVFGLCIEGRPS